MYLGRPSRMKLDALLVEARSAHLSYPHVGSTIDPSPGPEVGRHELLLGTGEECFARAVERLRAWKCHEAIKATVHPPSAAIEEGVTVLVSLPAGPLSIVVPNRIVAVIEEPRLFGFAYGTLDGHHERGEEAFLIEHGEDDRVEATVTIDATEATVVARLAGPVLRRFQGATARGYLSGLATP
jgi:uncharacterized protein (UPF0548 family)